MNKSNYQLKILKGYEEGKITPLKTNVTIIGRKIGTILIPDCEISSKHCVIKITSDTVQLSDLNSSNGTFVNGTRIKATHLSHLDKIQIGQTVLEFLEEPLHALPPVFGQSELENKIIRQDNEIFFHPEKFIVHSDSYKTPQHQTVISKAKSNQFNTKDEKNIKDYEHIILDMIDDELKNGGPPVLKIKFLEDSKLVEYQKPTVSIGRKNCDLNISDSGISRFHAECNLLDNNKVVIKDNGSTNGIYVNSVKVNETIVTKNDIVVIGKTKLQIWIE